MRYIFIARGIKPHVAKNHLRDPNTLTGRDREQVLIAKANDDTNPINDSHTKKMADEFEDRMSRILDRMGVSYLTEKDMRGNKKLHIEGVRS